MVTRALTDRAGPRRTGRYLRALPGMRRADGPPATLLRQLRSPAARGREPILAVLRSRQPLASPRGAAPLGAGPAHGPGGRSRLLRAAPDRRRDRGVDRARRLRIEHRRGSPPARPARSSGNCPDCRDRRRGGGEHGRRSGWSVQGAEQRLLAEGGLYGEDRPAAGLQHRPGRRRIGEEHRREEGGEGRRDHQSQRLRAHPQPGERAITSSTRASSTARPRRAGRCPDSARASPGPRC